MDVELVEWKSALQGQAMLSEQYSQSGEIASIATEQVNNYFQDLIKLLE